MKLTKLALVAAIACGIHAGSAFGQNIYTSDVTLASHGELGIVGCECGEPACGCEEIAVGCDGALGGCDGLALESDCGLGDPFTLFGEQGGWNAGGWVQMGYHSNDIPLFNQHKNNFNLHQGWLFVEKAIDTENGFDIGGRIDYLYGVDAQDTQAFGTDPRGWDNSWDNGSYGHALPQAYVEAGYGDLSVKVGHFFTLIGYEVVAAPDNFFYSHTYSHYNSEPFTHTGALATYKLSDSLTVYGGYTLGWDSGFDDNGDNFIGGVSVAATDNWTLSYSTVGGRFGEARFNGVETGYMHSVISDYRFSDRLQYILQSDVLSTEGADGVTARETFDISQYLLYSVNDCLALGARFEWYEQEGIYSPVGNKDDIYATTFGVNYRPHANLIFRPELRVDYDNAAVAGLDHGTSQTTFGFDTILTF